MSSQKLSNALQLNPFGRHQNGGKIIKTAVCVNFSTTVILFSDAFHKSSQRNYPANEEKAFNGQIKLCWWHTSHIDQCSLHPAV
jgi:hypothetical protein